MCYAKPGTRCLGHVQQEMSKLKTAINDESDLKAKNKMKAKYYELRRERDYTKAGLQELREKSQKIPKNSPYEARLRKAEEVYNQRARDYDSLNGTVDYRKPASDTSVLAMEKQVETIRQLNNEYSNAGSENTIAYIDGDTEKEALWTKKQNEIKEKLDKAVAKYNHMQMTRSHIDKGIIKDNTPVESYKKSADLAMEKAKKSLAKFNSPDGSGKDYQYALSYKAIALGEHRKAWISQKNGQLDMPVLIDSEGNQAPYGMTYDQKDTAVFQNYQNGESYEYTDGVADEGKKFSAGGKTYTIVRRKQNVRVEPNSGKIVADIPRLQEMVYREELRKKYKK